MIKKAMYPWLLLNKCLNNKHVMDISSFSRNYLFDDSYADLMETIFKF